MKTYMGIPGAPAMVTVTDSKTGRTATLEGNHGWGKPNPVQARQTAWAILSDYLQGDPGRARRLFTRFQWRVIASKAWPIPWTISGAEIAMELASIEAIERETEKDRRLIL